ncbi:MAG: hypothetical protein ACXAD7_09965 [Candidatus Kariarchaeaceae archaeon]
MKKILALHLIISILMSNCNPISILSIHGQNTSSFWYKTYGYEGVHEFAEALVQTTDGGFVIAGSPREYGFLPDPGPVTLVKADSTLVKADSSGNMLWNKTIGRSVVEVNGLVQTTDNGFAMVVDSQFDEEDEETIDEFWLIKTDGNGSMQWNQTYGRGIMGSFVHTDDGGFALVHENSSLIKTDHEGKIEWIQEISMDPKVLVQTKDHGFAIAGLINSRAGLVKTDSEGNVQWSQWYGEYETVDTLVQTSDGGFALGGGSDMWLLKTVSNGTLQWTYFSDSSKRTIALVQTTDEGFALIGEAHISFSRGDDIFVKIDRNGNMQWNKTYDWWTYLSDLVQVFDGGFAFSGNTMLFRGCSNGNSVYDSQMLLVKTNSSGYSSYKPPPYFDCGDNEEDGFQLDFQSMIDILTEEMEENKIIFILPVLLIISYFLYRRIKNRITQDKGSGLYPDK